MPDELRPYQVEDVEAVINALDSGLNRVMIEDATGLGKTTIAAEIVKRRIAQGIPQLFTVHRTKLCKQLRERIRDHCGLSVEFGNVEIMYEHGTHNAPEGCKVVICTIQSMTPERIERLWSWMTQNGTRVVDLHTDECHQSATLRASKLHTKFNVYGLSDESVACNHVGYTATSVRMDGRLLYAVDENGVRQKITRGRSKREYPAEDNECIYQKLVSRRDLVWGADNAWLVRMRVFDVPMTTDVSQCKILNNGEYEPDEYAKLIDNWQTSNDAINAFLKHCPERQAIVFCASVEHAKHTAEWFKQAGISAAAVWGEMDEWQKEREFLHYECGKTRVLTNFALVEEGYDLPNISCVIWLRETKSQKVLTQGTGRGLRPEHGILNDLNFAPIEQRELAISASNKTDCYVLCAKFVGSIGMAKIQEVVGVPSTMMMDGEDLIEVKRRVEDFCKATKRDISECPLTYQEVEVILKRRDLLEANTKVKDQSAWIPSTEGYKFVHTIPGYSAKLIEHNGGETWQLVVTGPNGAGVLLDRVGKSVDVRNGNSIDLSAYLNKAAEKASAVISDHKASVLAPKQKGTLDKISDKQKIFLRKWYRFTDNQIDCFSIKQVKAMIAKKCKEWNSNKETIEV